MDNKLNATTSEELKAEVKEFYDRTLLERMVPNLPFLKYGQKRPIPKGNGKTIKFRKFKSLAPTTEPLTEGVTPEGNSLTVTEIEATVSQYGDYVTITDLLETTSIDPVVTETIEILGEQAGETLNIVVRDELLNTTSEFNVGGYTTEDEITAEDILTVDDVLTLQTIFKANNIKPFENGYYLMFLAPEQAADIMRDPLWRDVSKYANEAKNIEEGEIGRLYKFKFIDTSLTGSKINTNGIKVHNGLAVGKNAYGITDIENGSKPKTIIKPAKEDDGDRSDPLNQRTTSGWKALLTAIRLNDKALIRVNSAAKTNVGE
ncbi:MAG: N4-gp56 family major capsid protein [Clostridia bacterium]|nr:N4-gp56 family major capsid protein [Clostridia bacterium]